MDAEEKILRLQLAKLRQRQAELDGTAEPVERPTPPKPDWSLYGGRVAVNSGPEYLPVTATVWGPPPRIYVDIADGIPVRRLEEAREIARQRGLKGIAITMKGKT